MLRVTFLIATFLIEITLLATAVNAALPKSDANIHGHVIDAETGEHLPYYLITIEGTSNVTSTDATGHYQMHNLNPGTYNIVATMSGFATQKQKITVEPGKSYEINFKVVPDAFLLDQVVVTGSKSET